jgi:hypothetical protein
MLKCIRRDFNGWRSLSYDIFCKSISNSIREMIITDCFVDSGSFFILFLLSFFMFFFCFFFVFFFFSTHSSIGCGLFACRG